MSARQRVGQLFMVGLSSSGPVTADDQVVETDHVGSVLLDGTGWDGAARVRRATVHLQGLAGTSAGGTHLLIAGNQEGGQQGSFQAFYGPGFATIPPAIDQGAQSPAALQAAAGTWGAQLGAAGVNLDLAPVAGVVPPAATATNQPLARYGREYGHDPATVATHVTAFVRGMRHSGEQVAVKHFPGLGRVTGNTDYTATEITDSVTGPNSPDLAPFTAGIHAGAGFVMVSLARYLRLDPAHLAAFSPTVIDGVLRHQLGFQGVVVSDDLAAVAASTAGTPGQRAVAFLAAGGDVAVTSVAADVGPMVDAVLSRSGADPGFARTVDAAVMRVLAAKQAAHLLACG
jgi:beta-N-acetylhexosaminidase